jgi:hypothetical protein
VNPALPDWLPELTIRNLRAGRGSIDLAVRDGTVEVLTNTTRFEVIHAPAPRPGGPDVTPKIESATQAKRENRTGRSGRSTKRAG